MTPEQIKEAEEASILFHIAMTQLGTQAMGDALALWDEVPPLPLESGRRAVSRWLGMAVRYVMRRRLRARDLALAYYRYQRALTTGTTIALPGTENPPYMTLPELKREFEAYLTPDPVIEESPSQAPESQSATNETQEVSEDAPANPEQPDEDEEVDEEDRILVEEIENLDALLDELEQQVEDEIEAALQALGPDNMDRHMGEIKSDSAEDVDAGREDAHAKAGRRQSATTSREVMNGARGPLHLLGSVDTKVIGYARASRTGTPCGFCAMLISRGFIPIRGRRGSGLYKSAQGSSANVTYGDLDLYHDNCQCYAVPIFGIEQMESDIFALNRKYADLWPIVTKGLGGKAAVSAWRRFIREEAQSQKSQEAAA